MNRKPNPDRVWRVRGYRGETIAHSRIYQRQHDAERNARECLSYYDRVTLDVATVGSFVPARGSWDVDR